MPNAISASRILFSIALIFIDNAALFIVCYLVCGISDVLDGYIARRYKLETKLGEKLDSLGDFVFWAVVLYLLFVRTNLFIRNLIIGACIIVVLRGINLAITKIKFGQWGMLHSWGNKATGLLLYILLPACIVINGAIWPVGISIFAVALLSSLDEMAILLSSKNYDANRKGYFIRG